MEVSGGGSTQFRVKGGDNSIQEYGEEGSESELEEAAAVLHDFYVANAEEDWPAACSDLAKNVVGQLKELASRSKRAGTGDCPETLAALTPPLPPAVRREATIVDAGSLRSKGEQAFLIYRGAKGAPYAIAMAREAGAWKVGALAGVPLQ